jgi:murein DD-endopeptidase MepM/ murein hydrolase activator NlpD
MNVILLPGPGGSGRPRHLNLADPYLIAVVAALIVCALGALFTAGLQLGKRATTADALRVYLQQQAQLLDLKARLQDRADAIRTRLAAMDAHLSRVNAFERQVASLAKIDHREFHLDDVPAAIPSGRMTPTQLTDLLSVISNLDYRAQMRGAELAALENVLSGRAIDEAIHPSGAPVLAPVISSPFGLRTDPVNGEEGRFHEGVDFAGVIGQQVFAVAAGIVTKAGLDAGYGNLVEINHGHGYVTRYAHNSRVAVNVGDIVVRGQPIAFMGSTGHSTGPHLHFEIRHNGTPVDPVPFLKSGPPQTIVARR